MTVSGYRQRGRSSLARQRVSGHAAKRVHPSPGISTDRAQPPVGCDQVGAQPRIAGRRGDRRCVTSHRSTVPPPRHHPRPAQGRTWSACARLRRATAFQRVDRIVVPETPAVIPTGCEDAPSMVESITPPSQASAVVPARAVPQGWTGRRGRNANPRLPLEPLIDRLMDSAGRDARRRASRAHVTVRGPVLP